MKGINKIKSIIVILSIISLLYLGYLINSKNIRADYTSSNIGDISQTTITQSIPKLNLSTTPSKNSCNEDEKSVAVIGDYGKSSKNELSVADLVKSWNVDDIITTGDNNYETGAQETIDKNIGQYYSDFIFPFKGKYISRSTVNKFFPSLGNHDWMTPKAKPYLDYFTLPNNERYYDFVLGPVHFFALDSQSDEPDGISESSIQAQWLKQKLMDSKEQWKIVYFHHPPFNSGAEHGSTIYMRWPFKQWGVNAVLSGHEHVYERLESNGLEYFVNGLGGAERYSFNQPISESKFRYNADFGAQKITVSDGEMKIEFINVKNQVIDSYLIKKEGC